MRRRGSTLRRAAFTLLAVAVAGAAVLPLVLDSAEEPGDTRASPRSGSDAEGLAETRPPDVPGAALRGPATPGTRWVDSGAPVPPGPPAAMDTPAADPASGPRPEIKVGQEVAWLDGTPVPYSPASAFVLPGERLHIDVQASAGPRRMVRADSAGKLESLGDDAWVWTAPDRPGVHTLRVVGAGGQDELVLHAFVMVPEGELEGGRLHGYRIGSYPKVPLRGDTMYVRPDGFVEVTEDNRDLRVSPRFRLRHFETKQGGDFPHYVVLQRKLLTKLELLVDALVDRGYPVTSLHVMSGYRTPAYNRRLGNVRYSRHQWGDASDLFVDEDDDGWMDDLTGDGRVDRADARVLWEVADSLDRSLDSRRLLGGLGLYGANARHGPFVHVDTRGSRARW